jgi:hypothetical protein
MGIHTLPTVDPRRPRPPENARTNSVLLGFLWGSSCALWGRRRSCWPRRLQARPLPPQGGFALLRNGLRLPLTREPLRARRAGERADGSLPGYGTANTGARLARRPQRTETQEIGCVEHPQKPEESHKLWRHPWSPTCLNRRGATDAQILPVTSSSAADAIAVTITRITHHPELHGPHEAVAEVVDVQHAQAGHPDHVQHHGPGVGELHAGSELLPRRVGRRHVGDDVQRRAGRRAAHPPQTFRSRPAVLPDPRGDRGPPRRPGYRAPG